MRPLRIVLAAFLAALLFAPSAGASTLTSTGANELTFTGGPERDGFTFHTSGGEFLFGTLFQPFTADPVCQARGHEGEADIFSCPNTTTRVVANLAGGPGEYDPSDPESKYDNSFTVADAPASVSFDVRGGDGADLVLALGGPATVATAAGPDFLAAGPADDTLVGGSGGDLLSGTGGNDTLYAGDRAPSGKGAPESPVYHDALNCGDGTDTAYAGPEDFVEPNCENVHIVKPKPGTQVIGNVLIKAVSRRGKNARVTIHCNVPGTCAGKITIRAGGKAVGSKGYSVPAGGDGTVKVGLSSSARKKLKKKGKLAVRVFAPQSGGDSLASERNFTLR